MLIWGIAAAVVANLVFWIFALTARLRRRPEPDPLPSDAPAVTLIRPFRGREENALEKNLSLVRQDHPNFEVMFIAEDEDDPGIPPAREACEAAPERARVLISRGVQVFSGKVRNMAVGWRASTAPLVAFCDSDIHLDPGDLTACARTFSDPKVGASWMPVVSREEGLHGRLWLLVTAVDGVCLQLAAPHLHLRQTLQGGLMVLRREALEAAGGIEQLGDTFADDTRAGNVIQRAGYTVRSSHRLVHHHVVDPFPRWLQRFHRWTICLRSEAPAEFFAQLVFNPVGIPLLAVLVLHGSPRAAIAWTVLAGSVALRLAGTVFVDFALLRPRGVQIGASALLRPLADLLLFGLSIAALVFPFVRWRGRWYRVGWTGRIVSHQRPSEAPSSPASPT